MFLVLVWCYLVIWMGVQQLLDHAVCSYVQCLGIKKTGSTNLALFSESASTKIYSF
jgi:hypothetical protein